MNHRRMLLPMFFLWEAQLSRACPAIKPPDNRPFSAIDPTAPQSEQWKPRAISTASRRKSFTTGNPLASSANTFCRPRTYAVCQIRPGCKILPGNWQLHSCLRVRMLRIGGLRPKDHWNRDLALGERWRLQAVTASFSRMAPPSRFTQIHNLPPERPKPG